MLFAIIETSQLLVELSLDIPLILKVPLFVLICWSGVGCVILTVGVLPSVCPKTATFEPIVTFRIRNAKEEAITKVKNLGFTFANYCYKIKEYT